MTVHRAIVATRLKWCNGCVAGTSGRLSKRAGPLPDIDPIEGLIRILGEANANSFSAGDIRGVRESSDEGRSPVCNDRRYVNS